MEQNFDNTKITVEFDEAGNRQQLSSGDSLKILFGKIKRWFSDLKPVAFSGDYNDLVNRPTIPVFNNAASHNGIFRGKDLTNLYTLREICTRIESGTFADLYIGDYFDITISTSFTTSEVVRCVLAGFDTYWNNGNMPFRSHHAVIVPKNCFTATAAMNPTNTTDGGFVGSNMWTTILPVYKDALQSALGNHILEHKTLLTNTIGADLNSNAGAGFKGGSSKWAWTSTYLSLLSEIQVYGSNVFSSSFYDTGCDNLQLPLFALDPTAKVCKLGGTDDTGASNRYWYWLRNIASASYFAYVFNSGISSYNDASLSFGVRPLFCIG